MHDSTNQPTTMKTTIKHSYLACSATMPSQNMLTKEHF